TRAPIMPQPGSSDYQTSSPHPPETHQEGVLDRARDLSGQAGSLAGELAAAVKERPYATLAVAAGLAFALGAVWKLKHQQPQSRLDALRAQLPEMPALEGWLPRRWR